MVRKISMLDRDIEKAIAITKMRIKHHEKHGCGGNTMRDKQNLQKQQRKKEKLDSR